MSFEPVPFHDDTENDLDAIRERMKELQGEGVKVPALELSPAPDVPAADPAPLGYITVRTKTWQRIPDGQLPSEGGTGLLWVVRGPDAVTVRPRVPEDGDAEYVFVDTPKPDALPKATLPAESFEEWRNYILNHGTNGQTAFSARVAGSGSRPLRRPPTYQSLREHGGGFLPYNRNANVE